jgi:hypothetical protein
MTDIIIIYQTDEQIEGLTVTPPQTDGTDYMCLCRCEKAPEGVTVLGTYEEVFTDEEKKAVYDRIYPSEYQLDEMRFGVFA